MTIGLTDDRVNDEKYALYVRWITGLGEGIRTVRLTPRDGNGAMAAGCDGVILTGGGDVDPALYGGNTGDQTVYGVSSARDHFEIDILLACVASETPVLGICRGMQLANVALGGTLIPDLEAAGCRAHRPRGSVKGAVCTHDILLPPGTVFRRHLGVERGRVVSSHHQAVGEIGRGLRVAATSDDGVTEALEGDPPAASAGLLLVQWHPERAESPDEPL
ncbi:MAG TPA: gamma-glutamyl-gamma-aminobutyrate hydrolase family protein, partial [Bacteroidota bacterium]|nr:gamma-glutamyl-gamma-aminobutyrate hydrolase family protein [Bacteroidota bacterium]